MFHYIRYHLGSRSLVDGLSLVLGRGGLLGDWGESRDVGINPAALFNLCKPPSSSLTGVLKEVTSQGPRGKPWNRAQGYQLDIHSLLFLQTQAEERNMRFLKGVTQGTTEKPSLPKASPGLLPGSALIWALLLYSQDKSLTKPP